MHRFKVLVQATMVSVILAGLTHAELRGPSDATWSRVATLRFDAKGERLYVTTSSAEPLVAAIECRTGQVAWKFVRPLRGLGAFGPIELSAESRSVYIGDTRGGLVRIDAVTGKPDWDLRASDPDPESRMSRVIALGIADKERLVVAYPDRIEFRLLTSGALFQTHERPELFPFSYKTMACGPVLYAQGNISHRFWNVVEWRDDAGPDWLRGLGDVMALSADGRVIAASDGPGGVAVVGKRDGTESRPLVGARSIHHLALTGDGLRVAGAADDGLVRVWDTTTGAVVSRFQNPDRPLTALAISPDGRLVAAAGKTRVVRISDAATGKELHAVELPEPKPDTRPREVILDDLIQRGLLDPKMIGRPQKKK